MTKRRAKHIALMQWAIVKEDFNNDVSNGREKSIVTYKEVALNKLYTRDKITLQEHDLIMEYSSCALCTYHQYDKDVNCPLNSGAYICSCDCSIYFFLLEANTNHDIVDELNMINQIINLIKSWRVK